MSTYAIDYSDPLKTGFTIQPGSFNGPGGSVSSSSLRLYGRGALEWGESVDEDLLRLLEHFAGATPPLNPTPGQLWCEQKLYWYDTTIALSAGTAPANAFYQYNLSTSAWVPSTGTTAPFTVTVIAVAITAYGSGVNIGDYVWSTVDNVLYRWDSAYKQALVAWLPRATTSFAGVPGAAVPEQTLQVQGLSGTFAAPTMNNIALTGVPTAPTAAVDTNTTQLATTAFVVGQAASVLPIIDGTATIGVSLRYARQDHIHPTDTSRAPIVSPTFTGVPAAPTAALGTNTTQLATTQFVVGQAATATPVMDGTAAVGTSTQYARQDHVHPTNISSAELPVINPVTPKDGDIKVAAGPIISIYATAAWRQIFPAVYS